MSALSPAPAPTSRVRWIDLPTPLDSALPRCCLSYKQSAFLSPLCFHNLTNCFSHNSFILITICVAPWCFPFLCEALCSDLRALCVTLFPAAARPVFSVTYGLFFSLGSLFRARVVYFQRPTDSF